MTEAERLGPWNRWDALRLANLVSFVVFEYELCTRSLLVPVAVVEVILFGLLCYGFVTIKFRN